MTRHATIFSITSAAEYAGLRSFNFTSAFQIRLAKPSGFSPTDDLNSDIIAFPDIPMHSFKMLNALASSALHSLR